MRSTESRSPREITTLRLLGIGAGSLSLAVAWALYNTVHAAVPGRVHRQPRMARRGHGSRQHHLHRADTAGGSVVRQGRRALGQALAVLARRHAALGSTVRGVAFRYQPPGDIAG